ELQACCRMVSKSGRACPKLGWSGSRKKSTGSPLLGGVWSSAGLRTGVFLVQFERVRGKYGRSQSSLVTRSDSRNGQLGKSMERTAPIDSRGGRRFTP